MPALSPLSIPVSAGRAIVAIETVKFCQPAERRCCCPSRVFDSFAKLPCASAVSFMISDRVAA